MNNDGRQTVELSSSGVSQQSPRNYSFLLRLSRQLGNVATKSSFIHDVKSFMSQEFTYDSAGRFITSMTHIGRMRQQGGTQVKQETGEQSESRNQNNSDADARKAAQKKVKDLKKIVSQSHEVLMSANTVFPMSLFPDTVTVDRTKVTITKRDFFWSSDTLSIRIEDVLNVSASVGPLFGSLTIASRVMSTIDHFKIDHFWRNDAIRLKHIIQGYVIAQHNNIDTAHLSRKELVETLVELGHDSNK